MGLMLKKSHRQNRNALPPVGSNDSPEVPISNLPHVGFRRQVVANWGELVEGDEVVLLPVDPIKEPSRGTVDAIMADGSLIWLVQKGPAGRRMFHATDGYKTELESVAAAKYPVAEAPFDRR
ncbi:hypothetical protein JOE31_002829 [Arthrobacter sp. PvP023]|uniref:hypothetical protein n=1 Tax=Micrococcaceae TaxID=1268 RepID=UPI001AEB05FB|nr:hypothetical protein [Arthrobacter sp. PvP023]MBP1136597.1 hypothetical protein [Arthrobacter sp. PvP023]